MGLTQQEIDGLDATQIATLPEASLRELAAQLLGELKQRPSGRDFANSPFAKYRALFDHFPLGVTLTDAAGNIIEANAIADRLMGVTSAEHLERSIDSPDWQMLDQAGQPLPPADYPPVRAWRNQITVKDEIVGRVDGQGRVTWLSVTATPLPHDGGGVVIAFEDVTVRLEAEATLRQLAAARERERHFRSMAAALPVIVWWAKRNGTREFFNRHYADFLGLDPDRVTGEEHEWRPFIHPDEVRGYLLLFKTSLRRQQPFESEFRGLRHDGQWRWVKSMGRPWWGPDGEYLGLVGVSLDITERKHAVLALQESNARLQEHTEKLAQLASQLTITEHRERQRFARLLHDGMQQDLIAVKFKLATLLHRAASDLVEPISEINALLDKSIETSRTPNADLSPAFLQEESFHPALNWLAELFKANHGLHVETDLDYDLPLERQDLRVVIFEAVREALLNIVKHAGVDTAELAMSSGGDDQVLVRIRDCGTGLGPQGGTKSGLRTIQERLGLLGGQVEFAHRAGAGAGTELRLLVPLSSRGRQPKRGSSTESDPED